ncbi:MAG: hypothetical protein WCJ30_10455, partial [Deltaproteobacteria bacterium]
MKRFCLLFFALVFAACGGDSPETDVCAFDGKIVACPDPEPAHAAPLCATPGGESATPVASCTWSTPPAIIPTAVIYGSAHALQACDKYAAVSPTGADARAMIVSS